MLQLSLRFLPLRFCHLMIYVVRTLRQEHVQVGLFDIQFTALLHYKHPQIRQTLRVFHTLDTLVYDNFIQTIIRLQNVNELDPVGDIQTFEDS